MTNLERFDAMIRKFAADNKASATERLKKRQQEAREEDYAAFKSHTLRMAIILIGLFGLIFTLILRAI